MTAPARKKRKKDRASSGDPALIASPDADTQPNADTDDFDFDAQVVYQVDTSIWRAVYNGHFRLAVKCQRCGRWLTAGRSKRAHLGPRCAKAVTK